MGSGAHSHLRAIKRPASEADQSSPSTAEVKNTWIIPPLHHTFSWRDV